MKNNVLKDGREGVGDVRWLTDYDDFCSSIIKRIITLKYRRAGGIHFTLHVYNLSKCSLFSISNNCLPWISHNTLTKSNKPCAMVGLHTEVSLRPPSEDVVEALTSVSSVPGRSES